ncbi:MAG: SUMF1/EgtB/PvdO family nonheme iron enzyme, partial [Myxococcota bacterium]|nr:SUMF1/EgtB/PvdO family nonheme iron enzyme [Myxococcota bacterium]
ESALDGQANDVPLSWCMSEVAYVEIAPPFGPSDSGTPGTPNQVCACSSEAPCNGCQGGSVEPGSCGECAPGEFCLAGQCQGVDFALISNGDGTPLEDPLGRYTLSRDFYLMTTELTQAQYHALMGPFEFKEEHGAGDDHAAHHITWSMAAAAANAMSAASGLDEAEWCYYCSGCAPTAYGDGLSHDTGLVCFENHAYALPQDCPGYRFPTEAEWELAARSGTTDEFWSGQGPALGGGVDDIDSCDPAVIEDGVGNELLGDYAWYCVNNTPNGTKEVGLKKPNGFGLFDMHGNAGEWVADLAFCWEGVALAPTQYPSPSVDPFCGPGSGSPETFRRHTGGSWHNEPKWIGHHSSVASPQKVHGHGGVRLARTVGPECVEGAPCDDLNACTTDDICLQGQCVGGATLSCESMCSCSASVCDPV